MGIDTKSATSILLLLVLCFCCTATEARRVNLTLLDNCEEVGRTAPVDLTSVRYEINPESGLCDVMHGEFTVQTVDTGSNDLEMTLFRCPADAPMPCTMNPVVHKEYLNCKRFVEDSSGPWHMFSESMSGSKCGEEAGQFTLDYSSLKIEHLINYLDITDDQFSKFQLKMNFVSETTGQPRGCGTVHFDLVQL